jgi:hypothetical protein
MMSFSMHVLSLAISTDILINISLGFYGAPVLGVQGLLELLHDPIGVPFVPKLHGGGLLRDGFLVFVN